jgi:hypothetical protein
MKETYPFHPSGGRIFFKQIFEAVNYSETWEDFYRTESVEVSHTGKKKGRP